MYTHKLEYDPNANVNNAKSKKKRQRKRNTTWFNPPYSEKSRLNLGSEFKKIILKHFPKGHILHKIFNKKHSKVVIQMHAKHEKIYLSPQF